MGQYSIWQQKTTQEDTTPISASSPQGSDSGRSPQMSTRGKATLAYGVMIARQGYQMGVSEIEARGNEALAMEIQNATRLLGYGTAIAFTKGLAAIPIVINEASQQIQQRLDINRENNMIQVKNRLRGQRLRVGGARD